VDSIHVTSGPQHNGVSGPPYSARSFSEAGQDSASKEAGVDMARAIRFGFVAAPILHVA